MHQQRWTLADCCQRVYACELIWVLNSRAGGMVRLALIAVSILWVAAWAQESDPGTAAAIRALEKQWTVGQARNDNRALDMIFDNALVYVEYGRLVSKGEYLSRIKDQTANLDQISMEPMSVRTFGDTAIVVGTYA